MVNAKSVFSLALGITLLAGHVAFAQSPRPATEKFFVNVNIGGQLADRSLSALSTSTVYDEEASLSSSQPIGRGLVVDFGGGYRVWNDIFAGIVISRFGNTEEALFTAKVPHPLFFSTPSNDRRKTTNGTITDLKRSEVAVSPHLTWVTTLTDKLDLTGSIGISFVRLNQDLVAPLCTAAGGTGCSSVPANTQDVVVASASQDGSGVGPFAQLDIIYNLMPRYAIGGFIRYAGAKVDLDSAADLNVGGMQAGAGIRLRF